MASSAHHLFLLALAFLAVAAPRADAWGGRLFFSKTTRPESVELDKAPATAVPEASEPEFSRPYSGGNRGYGLYGHPEEDFPPAYFRRGVHRDAEKRTTTNAPADEPRYPEDGSGRGRPLRTTANVPEVPAAEGADEPQGYPEDGSGRGRPLPYHPRTRGGRYGMSDTRTYQNGRYYYDVDTGKYGYGYESNPVRTSPEERRARYGDEYRNGNEFGNGVAAEDESGFQGKQNGQYIP